MQPPKAAAQEAPALLRTFAGAMLAFSLTSLFCTVGLSFLSSLMLISAALAILCAFEPQLVSEVQGLPAAPATARALVVSGCNPQRSAYLLTHVHGLALSAVIFGVLEVAASVTIFSVIGVPYTTRFANNILLAPQPSFSRSGFDPASFTFAGVPLAEFDTSSPPDLPPFSVQPLYADADGGVNFLLLPAAAWLSVAPHFRRRAGFVRRSFPRAARA